jgi:flagellar FliL protein
MKITGNKILDYVLLAFSFLSAAALLGIVFYSNFIYQRPLPSEQAEFAKMQAAARNVVFAESFKLNNIVVNLPHPTAKLRFLDMILHLVPFEGKHVEMLEKYKPQISDIVISVSSKMKPDDLNTATGKILLESRIKEQINDLLGKAIVKEILFSKFVIQ